MTGAKKSGRGVPAYQRLADDLRSALKDGRFQKEKPMPTEAELAQTYSVSRQTVRRAFQDLVGEGLVYRVAGRGTFPSSLVRHGHYVRSIGTIEDILAFTGTEMEIIRPMELVADEEAARRLELQSKGVAALVLRRLYEGVPFALTHVYLPPELGQRLVEAEILPARGPGTVIGTIDRLIPGTIAGANQTITTALAPPDVAPYIEYEVDQCCLRTERTYFDTEGTPVQVTTGFYNPNRYTYRLQMRRRAT